MNFVFVLFRVHKGSEPKSVPELFPRLEIRVVLDVATWFISAQWIVQRTALPKCPKRGWLTI